MDTAFQFSKPNEFAVRAQVSPTPCKEMPKREKMDRVEWSSDPGEPGDPGDPVGPVGPVFPVVSVPPPLLLIVTLQQGDEEEGVEPLLEVENNGL